jgi:PIN domain nuclease of toxin-antitoxin system
MRLLLDTHTFLWWLFDDPKLSATIRATIADASNVILVSAASAWEIAVKHRKGKLPEAGDVAPRVAEYITRARFTPLAITIEHATAAGALPGPHDDPFDRMLIAQAMFEDIAIATTDRLFRDYGARIIW